MRIELLLGCLAGLILLMAGPARAETLQVVAGAPAPGSCGTPRDSITYPDLASALQCALEGDTVQLGAGTWTGPGNRGLTVERSVRIAGAGRLATIVDAEQADRHLLVEEPGVDLTIEDLTLANGLRETEEATACCGALLFQGRNLNLRRCGFENNVARDATPFQDWSVAVAGALGIERLDGDFAGQVEIEDCVFRGNRSESLYNDTHDAAISIAGSLTAQPVHLRMTRTAFFDNQNLPGEFAQSGSGASLGADTVYLANVVYDAAGLPRTGGLVFVGPALIEFSTLRSGHTVVADYTGEVVVRHSIIESGTQACESGAGFMSAGMNLVSDASCDLAETDLLGLDPRLQRVDHGLAPPHLAILSDSPALDAAAEGCGSLEGGAVAIDQRGMDRPFGARCDIGAYERVEPVFGSGFEATSPD